MDIVVEARRRCEVEEVQSKDSIFHCRYLLTHMKIKHLKESVAQVSSASDDALRNAPELPPELEQLEKLLQKAFRARSTAATSGDASTTTGKGRTPLSASCKPQSRSSTKDNVNKRPTPTAKVQASVRATHGITGQRGQPARGAQGREPSQPTQRIASKPGGTLPVNTGVMTKASLHKPSSKDLTTKSKQGTQRKTSSSDDCEQCGRGQSDADSQDIPEEMWISYPLLPAWSALHCKQRRLWDQALAKSAQVVPEKAHFTQMLQRTFATEMPPEPPVDSSARLDRLTELSRALQQCHCNGLKLSQSTTTTTTDTLSGGSGRRHESLAMLPGLEERMKGVLVCIQQLTTAFDEHYGWEPGALCPVRRRGAWGSPGRPCLPSTVCYSSPAQLQELAYLRLRVDLLHQETQLQQVLQDHLGAGPPPSSAAQLRGQYSLLGEGGLYFPTLVMDTEPE
ncbi:uncharacterized protein LOC134466004 isoform X2 [Engraulis encrasicolus]